MSTATSVAVAANQRLDAVKGVVERRPHQLGHAGIEHDEALRARELLDVDDRRQQHAGRADEDAAGLDRHLQAAAARRRDQRADVRRPDRRPGCRRRKCRARRPCRDAASSMPSPRRSRASATTASAALAERIERGDLRSDVHVRADRQQPAPRRHLAEQRRRFVDRHAELVRLAGRWRCADGSSRRCRG